MEKRTLKFSCLIHMAKFSSHVSAGYLINTNNNTLTGRLSDEEIHKAVEHFEAYEVETTEKVFSYEV
jgi:hypothetical protein